MAGPNQTGDKDKKLEDTLRNDESTQALSRDNDTQNATLDATATPAQTITDTKKDDIPTLDQDIEPLPTPEEIAATQDAESSVMVGRDTNNIGDNATSNATLDAAELISSGPGAQDIENDAHKNETQYGFGADAAAKQMNDALSGAGEGKTNTTFTAKTSDAEEQKRREDSLANIRAIAMSAAELAAAYDQLGKDIQAMDNKLNDISGELSRLELEFAPTIDALESNAQETEAIIATLNQELQDLDNAGLSPEALATQQQRISEKITQAEECLNKTNNAISETKSAFQDAKNNLEKANVEINSLSQEVAAAIHSDAPETNLAAVQARKDIVEERVSEASTSTAAAFDQLAYAKLVANTIPGNDTSLTDAQIASRTSLASVLTSAGQSGDFNQTELDDISKQLEASGISKEDRNDFIKGFTALSGTITVDDPDNLGQSKTLDGDSAVTYLQDQWDALTEKIIEIKDDIVDYGGAALDGIKALLASALVEDQEKKAELNRTNEILEKEQSESIIVAAGVKELTDNNLKYGSVYDYMSTNYSVTLFGITAGEGENIELVANDKNRILKHDDKLVYISPDTQEMYTLGANGEKIDVPLADTVQLYQKMYNDKLLPRNFVKDEGGAYDEYSEHDSFSESIAKSIVPGYMTAEGNQNLIERASKAEAQQAADAKIDADKALASVNTAKGNVADAQNSLNQTTGKIASLRAELEQAEKALAEVEEKQTVLANSSAGEENTTQIAASVDTNSTAAETQWEGKEAHDMAIPDHDLADAEASRNSALKEVELAALNGESISQEDYNKLKDLPGMSGTQLNDMMEKNKVALEQSVTSPDNNSVGANPSNTIIAQQFGVQFEVTPIQVPMAPSPNPNGISPADNYVSFADSIDFTKTNDPSSTTNSFDPVAVKQSENSPVATTGFANALIEKPDESETGAPKIDGLTPLQAEQLRMQEENQRQATLAALAAHNAGAGGGGATG